MSTPVISARQGGRRGGFSALIGLIVVLLGAMACAAVLTAYLLRIAPGTGRGVALTTSYRILILRDGQIWALGHQGRERQITTLPPTVAGSVNGAQISPDGTQILLVGASAAGHQYWVLSAPGGTPQALPDPPVSDGSGTGQFGNATWADERTLAVVFTQQGRAWLVRYTVDERQPLRVATTVALHAAANQVISLSPDGEQIAVVRLRAARGDFAPQAAIRLQHVESRSGRIAYRYLGRSEPEAFLWSADNGTIAIAIPGQGLAIEKSSGRTVRLVSDGSALAAFSRRTAQLVYISGMEGAWQIHVLALHTEADRQVGTTRDRPTWITWAPDEQSVIYTNRTGLHALQITTGDEQLQPLALGTVVGAVAAGSVFAR